MQITIPLCPLCKRVLREGAECSAFMKPPSGRPRPVTITGFDFWGEDSMNRPQIQDMRACSNCYESLAEVVVKAVLDLWVDRDVAESRAMRAREAAQSED